MIGTIRTKEKCPVCQGKFTEIPRAGFICEKHRTTPTRLYIDFYYKKRFKIYSDKHGQPVDSYQRAVNLQSWIDNEITNNNFDPADYKKSELEKYYVSTLLGGFLESKLYGNNPIAPSYVRHYRRYVGIAKDYFGTIDTRDIRKLHVINYQSYVGENYNFSNKTLKNCVDIFKTFMLYVKNDLELISIVPHFPVIDIPEPMTTWLSQAVQIEACKHIPDHDKPIMACLMLEGCRPGEARAMKCKDVDLEHGLIIVSATFSDTVYRKKRKGKRAKPVRLPIHPEMLEYIKYRVESNLPEAFLFVNQFGRHYSESALQRLWSTVRYKIGLDKSVRLYDATRHTFATLLINSGVGLSIVSELLGHSSTKTTEKYIHADTQKLKIDISNLSLKEKVIELKKGSVPGLSPVKKQRI